MPEEFPGGPSALIGSETRPTSRDKWLYSLVLAAAVLLLGMLTAVLIREQYAQTLAVWKARESGIAMAFMMLLAFAALLAAYQRHAAARENQRTEERLRRLNRALRTVSECNQALVRATSESQLLKKACQILVDHGGFRLAWVGYAPQDKAKSHIRAASAGDGNGSMPTGETAEADDEIWREPTGAAIRAAQPVIVRDIRTEGGFTPWRDEALRRGYASMIALPLVAHGKAFGALALCSGQRDAFDTAEVELLSELSNDLAYGISALQNLEKRFRSEERLRRLQLAVDGSNDVVFMTDRRGVITYVNPAFTRIYGYKPEEVVGKTTPRLLKSGDIDPEAYKAFWEMLLEKRPVLGEFNNKTKDGRRVTIEASASAIINVDGEISGFLGIQRDITEHKRAEEALRASEIQYRRLFEAAHDGILILDAASGRITDVNPYLEQLLGFPRRQIIGKFFWEIEAFKEIASSRADFQVLQKEGSVRYDDKSLAGAAGLFWHVEFASNTYTVNGGKVIQCNIRDITDRKRSERALKKTQEQFLQSQKMEAVGLLAGGVAHDFNNLLTVISGYSDLMMQTMPPGHPQRARLEEIQRAGERASALTRQLLAFSRKQLVVPSVLDLNVIVEGMANMLRRLIGEDIRFKSKLAEGLGRTRADAGQVEQVIMNLAVNARDAMPRGGVMVIETANVELDEEYARSHAEITPGKYVLLALSDTGCGMDAKTQSRIFEPFYTTKGAGRGSGLGLSTVYGIVKQSGGHISVYSEVGRGTTFKVFLPRVDEPVEAAPVEYSSSVKLAGSETILLVEDEPGVRMLAQTALESYGYKVLAAEGPEAALELWAKHKDTIHILLTDVVMPGMNGKEMADRMKQAQATLKVLFISGYTADAIAQHGILEEGVAFLPKPFTPRELLARLRRALDSTAA